MSALWLSQSTRSVENKAVGAGFAAGDSLNVINPQVGGQSEEDRWREVADRFGLRVDSPAVVKLDDGSEVTATALLHGVGAPKGMLVVDSADSIAGRSAAISASGYGFSVVKIGADLGSVRRMLRDWGWRPT